MKSKIHAVAGVLGFLIISVFIVGMVASALRGHAETLAQVQTAIFWAMFLLLPALAGAGASGMSMLGKRSEPLGAAKQRRGPIAFMTSLFVLLPSSYFLSSWAAEDSLGPVFHGVQALQFAAASLCFVMIGLNIRDGLAMRGRIAPGARGPKIEARGGGPLVVLRVPSMTSADGRSLDNKPVMALCRCGASKNKPFCDGSHNDIGFDSQRSDQRTKDEVLVYEGKDITVHYNRLLCSHAAECGRRNKAAFDSSRKPWIEPDRASKEQIMDIVQACPSGALRYSLPGAKPQHARSDAAGIKVEKNGPYRVSGVALADAELATGASAEKYVLCRCGASKNKPYCDGTHVDIGWDAEAAGRGGASAGAGA